MLLKLVILNFNNEQIFATINDKQPNYKTYKYLLSIILPISTIFNRF